MEDRTPSVDMLEEEVDKPVEQVVWGKVCVSMAQVPCHCGLKLLVVGCVGLACEGAANGRYVFGRVAVAGDRGGGTVVRDAIAVRGVDGILRRKRGLLNEEGGLGPGDMRSLDNGRASEGSCVLGRGAGSWDLVVGEVVDLRLLLQEESFELIYRS